MSRRPVHDVGARQPILVTGGAGFIGSNLVDRLARDGHQVLVYDALARPGVEANLAWLQQRHPRQVSTCIADIRDADALGQAVAQAQAVFHLAGQVAVTTSLLDPLEDFEVNLHGTVLLLEALRRRGGHTPLIFASTNKVYGNLADVALEREGERYLPQASTLRARGIDETRALSFHTPYGCSKGAADQYVLDYARSFAIPTAVFRMSCIYGERQMGTEDQGWVAHFLIRALRGTPIRIFGDGCQVRDVLHVADAVAAYLAAWRRIDQVQGQAFNLGGGPANAVSLRQVIAAIEDLLGYRVETQYEAWRAGDQRYYVSDTSRAVAALGLPPPTPWRTGLLALAGWLREANAMPAAAPVAEALP